MNATRLDMISKLFATRRSRRQALAQAGAGLAAAIGTTGLARQAAAQDDADATPFAAPSDNDAPVFLFLQAFQAGSVAPKEGAEDRYTLTLEQGLGHTVYFSDRPDRIVGATPTPKFLVGLGFLDDNPPNAALVVETDGGQTEVAVVQLFSPSYDEPTRTATYEVSVLASWEREGDSEGTFSETAADLSAFGSSFGASHLFIDDCPNGGVTCYAGDPSTEIVSRGSLSGIGFCWHWDLACCKPCDPNWYNTWALECDRVYGCDQKYALGPGYCWASMETPAFGCAE